MQDFSSGTLLSALETFSQIWIDLSFPHFITLTVSLTLLLNSALFL